MGKRRGGMGAPSGGSEGRFQPPGCRRALPCSRRYKSFSDHKISLSSRYSAMSRFSPLSRFSPFTLVPVFSLCPGFLPSRFPPRDIIETAMTRRSSRLSYNRSSLALDDWHG